MKILYLRPLPTLQEKPTYLEWAKWVADFASCVEIFHVTLTDLGPGTLKLMLSKGLHPNTWRQLQFRSKWNEASLTWGVLLPHLREIVGMTRTALHNALHRLKQPASMSA